MMMKLNEADEVLMNRLFGPQLPLDDPFTAEETERAKSVDWSPPLSPFDVRVAMATLLSAIVHTGIGGGTIIGWSLGEADGRVVLAVHRVKVEPQAKAA
jgi:hypothetical protein